MHVVVTGGTGFIGRHLVAELVRRGDHVTVLSRSGSGARTAVTDPEGCRIVRWDPGDRAGPELGGAEAIVHLAGSPALGVRWTRTARERIQESRVETTRHLVAAIARSESRPKVLVSASAVGYYGSRRPDEELDERAEGGSDWLAELVRAWERAASEARDLGVRVVLPRFGMVLGRGGGALPSLLGPVRWFAGGPLGTGEQIISWIHVSDAVEAIIFCLGHDSIDGAVNLTAPAPVTEGELVQALGARLARPVWLRVPAWALRWRFGEGAEPLLTGQRVRGAVLAAEGFRFRYPTLAQAIADLLPDAEPGRC